MHITSENSTFNGSFAEEFHGTVKGLCGPEDETPPSISCPLPSQELSTTPATNDDGQIGFIVTYPDPLAADNCDPAPFVFADVPSGTFPAAAISGDAVTITTYALDVSGP